MLFRSNLGWKLAAAVRGWGDEALPDSYHDERHRIGREVLRSSGAIIRLSMIKPKWARAAQPARRHPAQAAGGGPHHRSRGNHPANTDNNIRSVGL